MHIFYGFNSFSKEIVVDNYLITASIEACALLCKFWSHKYGFSQIIHMHVVDFTSLWCPFLLHLVIYWFCGRLCYHLGIVFVSIR